MPQPKVFTYTATIMVVLVFFRLFLERNVAKAPLASVWKNEYTFLIANEHNNAIDVEDETDELQPMAFLIHDSKFNFTVGTKDMASFANDFFSGTMCGMFNVSQAQVAASDKISLIIPKLLVTIRFSCQDLFRASTYGTGNFISAVYAFRMADCGQKPMELLF